MKMYACTLIPLLLFILHTALANKIQVAPKSVCFHGDAANWVHTENQCSNRNEPKGESRPMFSASIRRDTSFNSGQAYQFNAVKVNVGSMYNQNTGKAIVPSDGNYCITWNVLTNAGYATYPFLKVNGKYESQTACDASGARGVRVQCGNTVILSLKKGDIFWVEEWVSNSRRKNVQAGFSTFTAWKL